MIGNRVRVTTTALNPATGSVTGVLKRLDAAGVTLWRDDLMPEQQCNVFIPMHLVEHILDLGRADMTPYICAALFLAFVVFLVVKLS